jgi:predicted nucleotidyltransferase
MKKTNTYIRLLRKFKQLHASEYGITRIGIFGSVARGEQKNESDIDIYFETDKKLTLFRMGGLMYDLEELFGIPVDLIHDTDRIPAILKQRIEKEIVYEC